MHLYYLNVGPKCGIMAEMVWITRRVRARIDFDMSLEWEQVGRAKLLLSRQRPVHGSAGASPSPS
jgi:hypothetical protein